jgi:hypothetical protein
MRSLIRYFRRHTTTISKEATFNKAEKLMLLEMFSNTKYTPHSETKTFKSFNYEFKDYIFAVPCFCHVFNTFYGKFTKEHINYSCQPRGACWQGRVPLRQLCEARLRGILRLAPPASGRHSGNRKLEHTNHNQHLREVGAPSPTFPS